jgi:hypothetical protein
MRRTFWLVFGILILASALQYGNAQEKAPAVDKSPVHVSAVYDPAEGYDGRSGPPPSGGKTLEIEPAFDDTAKMP